MAIYRRKQAEVDALPIDAGTFAYRYRGDDETHTMPTPQFLEEFEEGEAARFTEEHLQELTRKVRIACREVKRLEIPNQQRGRPVYREGFTEAIAAVLQLLQKPLEQTEVIKSEYGDWDSRVFTA